MLDLATGAPKASSSGTKSGLVYVFHGTTSGLELWKEMDQSGLGGNEDDDRFGSSLAAGDFNNDGFDIDVQINSFPRMG